MSDDQIIYDDRWQRINAVSNLSATPKEVAKLKLTVDCHDDEEVTAFIEEHGGIWSGTKDIPLPSVDQLKQRRKNGEFRTGTRLFMLGDSNLNQYKCKNADLEREQAKAGYCGKTRNGNPRSRYVRARPVLLDIEQQCAERGYTEPPTEFEDGFIEFEVMPGQPPGVLAKRLNEYKAKNFENDLVIVSCMLNGMTRTNKNFQVIPDKYEDQIHELFAAAKDSGPRVIVILGGDANKWSIGGAPYYNKVRDDFINTARHDYDLTCI